MPQVLSNGNMKEERADTEVRGLRDVCGNARRPHTCPPDPHTAGRPDQITVVFPAMPIGTVFEIRR